MLYNNIYLYVWIVVVVDVQRYFTALNINYNISILMIIFTLKQPYCANYIEPSATLYKRNFRFRKRNERKTLTFNVAVLLRLTNKCLSLYLYVCKSRDRCLRYSINSPLEIRVFFFQHLFLIPAIIFQGPRLGLRREVLSLAANYRITWKHPLVVPNSFGLFRYSYAAFKTNIRIHTTFNFQIKFNHAL